MGKHNKYCPKCNTELFKETMKCFNCGYDFNNDNLSLIESIKKDGVYLFDGNKGDILKIYEDRVELMHLGVVNFLIQGAKGLKTIFYSNITSIQVKKSGELVGYIQFSLLGGVENTAGVFGAVADENSIAFDGIEEHIVDDIKNYILEKIRTTSSGKFINNSSVDPYDEIRKLKSLFDDGIITQEEFDAKKKQLLGL